MSRPGVAETLAALHAEAFDAPWNAPAFQALLAQTGVFLIAETEGFILCRVVADEAEILTLAVRPPARRTGLGSRLVAQAANEAAARQATRLFLEVAEDNAAALALYTRAAFDPVGRRPRYYARTGAPAMDALILARNLA